MNESFILDVNEVLIPEMIIEDNDSQKGIPTVYDFSTFCLAVRLDLHS